MRPFTTAYLDWFNRKQRDATFLEKWQTVPITYQLQQKRMNQGSPSYHWQHHFYQRILTSNTTELVFKQAIDQLMRYQFYPARIMTHISHFSVSDRWMKLGDRIVQRIPIIRFNQQAILDVVGMTEIARVWLEPHRCGFTYVTTAKHAAEGEWTAEIHWLPNDQLQLTVSSYSRPSLHEPFWSHPFMNRLQKRAHLAGLNYFSMQLERNKQHILSC